MQVDEILGRLREMGCKLTPQRRMLLDAMVAGGEEQTADEIYQAIRVVYPDVGLDTVYRNLRLLVKLNIVDEVKLPGKLARYCINTRMHQHGLVCLDCGTEIALGHCPIRELETLAREEHGFVISSHRIELFGYCGDCTTARSPA